MSLASNLGAKRAAEHVLRMIAAEKATHRYDVSVQRVLSRLEQQITLEIIDVAEEGWY